MSAQLAASTARDVTHVASDLNQPFAEPQTTHSVHRYAVRFDGEGKSYWPLALKQGLWLVLTLGLAWPWVRAAHWRYVVSHTHINHVRAQVDAPALDGQLLFVLVGAACWLAWWTRHLQPAVSWSAGSLALLLWPSWKHQAQRAQAKVPHWQGLRWQYTGRRSQVYRLYALPLIGLTVLMGLGTGLALIGGAGQTSQAGWILLTTLTVGGLICMPYWHWRLIRHHQHHLTLHDKPMRFRASALDLYRIWAHTTLMGAMSLTAASAVFGVVAFWAWSALPAGASHTWLQTMATMAPVGLVFAAFSLVLPVSYVQTHIHNLRWNQTGSEWLRFKSHLKTRDQLRMNTWHLAKMLGSAGLYWPYATMQSRASRMQSVTIVTRLPLDQMKQVPSQDLNDRP